MPFTERPASRGVRWMHRAAALMTLGLVACSPPRPPGVPAASAPDATRAGSRAEAAVPSGPARDWNDYRLRVALRLVQANPERTYLGEVPEPLLAIPVLEIELNADGSIRHIAVQRQPGQARDTVQLAIDAVKRAAPFGDVSHLKKPWKFNQVFLFNDDRRFKPRELEQ